MAASVGVSANSGDESELSTARQERVYVEAGVEKFVDDNDETEEAGERFSAKGS